MTTKVVERDTQAKRMVEVFQERSGHTSELETQRAEDLRHMLNLEKDVSGKGATRIGRYEEAKRLFEDVKGPKIADRVFVLESQSKTRCYSNQTRHIAGSFMSSLALCSREITDVPTRCKWHVFRYDERAHQSMELEVHVRGSHDSRQHIMITSFDCLY